MSLLVVGEKIQGYEILSMLGAGGFGAVYRAKDINLGREVAIKVLSNQDKPINRARFRDEGRLLAKLQHPKIIQVFSVGELEDGSSFLVMELYGKGSLNYFFPLGVAADINQSISIIKDLLNALIIAHQQGIVHRDLKEANLLYDPIYPNQIKLCDFGIARSQEPLSDEAESTADGRIVGTCHYIAPERYRGMKDDPRSDLFSVGVIFYRLLCGHKPFERNAKEKPENIVVMQRVLNESPPTLPAHIPLKIARICYQLLAKSLDIRFQSAQEALMALQQAQAMEDTHSQSAEISSIDFQSIDHQHIAEQSTQTFEPHRQIDVPIKIKEEIGHQRNMKKAVGVMVLVFVMMIFAFIGFTTPSKPAIIDLSRSKTSTIIQEQPIKELKPITHKEELLLAPKTQPMIQKSDKKADKLKTKSTKTIQPASTSSTPFVTPNP